MRSIMDPEHPTKRESSTMRFTTKTRHTTIGAAAVAALLVAACGSSTPTAAPSTAASEAPAASASTDPNAGQEPVTIVVGALRPGVTQEAVDALNLQISEFEAKYPWIDVEPEEYNWTAPTFTAALAAGTLPDVFTIPFTDGKGLIANHQIVNIDERVRELGYADKFNPNVLVNGQDADGAIWAVPTQAYGMSLTYNRTLFEQAGLDPNNPPKTWDEVRTAAKTIAEKTGVAGFAQMATENTGGWQATTATYTGGGRMEQVGDDGKVTATLNNDATKAALERLKAMRWEDNSMGSTFDYAWGSINQAFAAGQIGMFTGGSDLFTWMIQNASITPADYGITILPLEGADSGVLAAARSRRSTSSPTRPSATRRSSGSTTTTCRSCSPRKAPWPTPRRSRRTTSRSACPPCRSSTRRPTTSPRSGSRTTSTCRSTRWRRSRPRSSTSRSSTSRSPTPRSCTRPSTRWSRPC